MSRTYAASMTAAALLLAGCDSKQIREYAKTLDALLADYKTGVQARIDAERKMYNTMSQRFAAEAERDVYESLKIERLHQQRVLTGDLVDGRLAPSQVPDKLRETALAEFERTRAWFEQELNAQERYQASLAKVSLDAKKLDALDDALQAVAKTTGLRTELQDLVASGTAFKTAYELEGCKDLERRIAIHSDSINDWKAEKPADPAEQAAVKQRLDATEAEKTALQTQLAANSHYKADAKKCQ